MRGGAWRRRDDDAGEVRQLRDHLRGLVEHAPGHVRVQRALELGKMLRVEGLDGEQGVHEQPVPRGVGMRPAEVCGLAMKPAFPPGRP